MKIVIYNTNSYDFDPNIFHYENYPSNVSCWKKILETYKNHEIIFFTQAPSLFLIDFVNDKAVIENLNVRILEKILDAEQIYQLIKAENPDVAVAASFWIAPFDWLCIKDALIGEKLQEKGIKTICPSVDFTSTCFDKYETHNLLKNHSFKVAKSVYVDHGLFWSERNRPEVLENIYKEKVFTQINKMNFPLVIKDTCGLSSYGMTVVKTFGEAKNFLCSKKNNGNKLVEELIPGLQFGTEIYSYDDKVIVNNPFIFSVNQYGITSPKQSVKIGPVLNPLFKIDELKSELKRLSKEMKLSGIIQVDLVFNLEEQKWYIIEINPRLSGMTQTLCASNNITVADLLMSFAENKPITLNQKCTAAIKFELLTNEMIEKLKALPFTKQINQTKNDAAKQQRECGYCELIFGGTDTLEELINQLEYLNKKFPEIMEEVFYKNSLDLIEKISF